MITIEMLKERLDLEKDWVIQQKLEFAIGSMEKLKIQEIIQIGCFIAKGVVIPLKGDKISMPKGISIRTTMPGDKAQKVCKRAYTVPVYRIDSGFFRGDDAATAFECQSTITWAGEGGYWHSVNTRDWINLGGAIVSRNEIEAVSDKNKEVFTVIPST